MRQAYHYASDALNRAAGLLHPLVMSKKVPKPRQRRTYIKEWREQRGWSQEELADMVGVTQETISRLENGKIAYTQPTLEAIADKLACEIGDLTDHDPTKDGVLVQLARSIPKEHREQAANILKTFIKNAS